MDRRNSLKAIALGTIGGAVLLDACKSGDNKKDAATRLIADGFTLDRQPEEVEQYEKVVGKTFFTENGANIEVVRKRSFLTRQGTRQR